MSNPSNGRTRDTWPTSVFDPSWEDPNIASHVGRSRYHGLLARGLILTAHVEAPEQVRARCGRFPTLRELTLVRAQRLPHTDTFVRASSCGVLIRTLATANGVVPTTLRLLNLAVGVDANGRCFLSGGLDLGGARNTTALVSATFKATSGPMGALAWSGTVECGRVAEVHATARCPQLELSFGQIIAVEVALSA